MRIIYQFKTCVNLSFRTWVHNLPTRHDAMRWRREEWVRTTVGRHGVRRLARAGVPLIGVESVSHQSAGGMLFPAVFLAHECLQLNAESLGESADMELPVRRFNAHWFAQLPIPKGSGGFDADPDVEDYS